MALCDSNLDKQDEYLIQQNKLRNPTSKLKGLARLLIVTGMLVASPLSIPGCVPLLLPPHPGQIYRVPRHHHPTIYRPSRIYSPPTRHYPPRIYSPPRHRR